MFPSMIRKMASARSAALVGDPTWSDTTFSSSFSEVSLSIVFMKFFPYGEYSQAVLRMIWRQPEAATALSPSSFVLPYTLTGFGSRSSVYGTQPSPSNT